MVRAQVVEAVRGGFESQSCPCLVTLGNSLKLSRPGKHHMRSRTENISLSARNTWMVEMAVVTSLLTLSPSTPTLSDTPERVPQAPPQHCSLPLSQVLTHKPLEKTRLSTHLLSLIHTSYLPLTQPPLPWNHLSFRTSLFSGTFCGIYTPGRARPSSRGPGQGPLQCPAVPRQGGVRGALMLVSSPLDTVSGSALSCCIALGCIISAPAAMKGTRKGKTWSPEWRRQLTSEGASVSI